MHVEDQFVLDTQEVIDNEGHIHLSLGDLNNSEIKYNGEVLGGLIKPICIKETPNNIYIEGENDWRMVLVNINNTLSYDEDMEEYIYELCGIHLYISHNI